MSKKVNFIIVGQGIAGTLIAHFLEKANQSFVVIDDNKKNSSSKLAAGIINPITGRRFVKSWMFDELYPFAKATYLELEHKLNTSFLYQHPIKRALFSQKEENDWDGRALDENYQPYMEEIPSVDTDIESCLAKPYSWGEIKGSGRMEMPLLVAKYRSYLIQKDLLMEECLDYSKLNHEKDGVAYKGLCAKYIIFCEGIGAINNPFFNYLPFVPSKGDVLFIRIRDTDFDKIIKHKVFIVPQGNEIYWIGSTYDWEYDNDLPSEIQATKLKEKLAKILTVPFEIVDHRAAIRPTVKDRRPFIGFHPNYQNYVIFNGLGTKGTTLGPFWANHLVNSIITNQKINPQVDIARFDNK